MMNPAGIITSKALPTAEGFAIMCIFWVSRCVLLCYFGLCGQGSMSTQLMKHFFKSNTSEMIVCSLATLKWRLFHTSSSFVVLSSCVVVMRQCAMIVPVDVLDWLSKTAMLNVCWFVSGVGIFWLCRRNLTSRADFCMCRHTTTHIFAKL